MPTIRTFLAGAAVGAAAMYLLDPKAGPERRQQVQELAEERAGAATRAAQDLGGTVIDATRPLHDRGPGSDPALADKVKSEVLGRDAFSDLSLNVAAVDGVVTLRGTVETSTRRRELIDAVKGVGGVKEVNDLLHHPDNPPVNAQPTAS